MDRLVGGIGTLRDKKPEKTVGSFWPYATTLFDYVRRAMPLNAPQSLTPDEVYAVSAYVLFLNGIVPQDTTLDAKIWPKSKCPTATASSAPIQRPGRGQTLTAANDRAAGRHCNVMPPDKRAPRTHQGRQR